MIALKTLPYGDIRGAGTVGVVRQRRGRGRPHAGGRFAHRYVEKGGATLIALDVAIEKRGDEMRVYRVDALLAPHRIFEPILIPEPLPHRVGHGAQSNRVTAALEGQQVPMRTARR